MKIILRKEHDKLGAAGAVVDVKDGYARNYSDSPGHRLSRGRGKHARP